MPLDLLAVSLNNSHLFAGGVSMFAFWWAWFRRRADEVRDRSVLLATLAGSFAAIVVGRVLALGMPFRQRPLHDPSLHFVVPYGLTGAELRTWSSFPSDHAMMFFELATGILLVSRRLGTVLLLHALLVVSLPRVYAGLHFPTDIIGGAAIGTLMAVLVTSTRLRDLIARPLLAIERKSPSAFYAALFLLSIEVVDMFDGPRAVLGLLLGAHRHAA